MSPCQSRTPTGLLVTLHNPSLAHISADGDEAHTTCTVCGKSIVKFWIEPEYAERIPGRWSKWITPTPAKEFARVAA